MATRRFGSPGADTDLPTTRAVLYVWHAREMCRLAASFADSAGRWRLAVADRGECGAT